MSYVKEMKQEYQHCKFVKSFVQLCLAFGFQFHLKSQNSLETESFRDYVLGLGGFTVNGTGSKFLYSAKNFEIRTCTKYQNLLSDCG